MVEFQSCAQNLDPHQSSRDVVMVTPPTPSPTMAAPDSSPEGFLAAPPPWQSAWLVRGNPGQQACEPTTPTRNEARLELSFNPCCSSQVANGVKLAFHDRSAADPKFVESGLSTGCAVIARLNKSGPAERPGSYLLYCQEQEIVLSADAGSVHATAACVYCFDEYTSSILT